MEQEDGHSSRDLIKSMPLKQSTSAKPPRPDAHSAPLEPEALPEFHETMDSVSTELGPVAATLPGSAAVSKLAESSDNAQTAEPTNASRSAASSGPIAQPVNFPDANKPNEPLRPPPADAPPDVESAKPIKQEIYEPYPAEPQIVASPKSDQNPALERADAPFSDFGTRTLSQERRASTQNDVTTRHSSGRDYKDASEQKFAPAQTQAAESRLAGHPRAAADNYAPPELGHQAVTQADLSQAPTESASNSLQLSALLLRNTRFEKRKSADLFFLFLDLDSSCS